MSYKKAIDKHFKKNNPDWDKEYRAKLDIEDGKVKVKVDNVNHPPHYKKGSIECLDAIRESMSFDQYKGYLKGNVEKYIWRMDYKGKILEDLGKAEFYLARLIEHIKENNNNNGTERKT